MSIENDKIIKEKLIEALSIMDNGKLDHEGHYVLRAEKGERLRHLIHVCFEMVDKSILDKLLER